MPAEITYHAKKRAKQRLSWNESTLLRMAQKALDEGAVKEGVVGSFGSWLAGKIKHHPDCAHIRIHGEIAYFFRGRLLVTLYQIPSKYKKHLTVINN